MGLALDLCDMYIISSDLVLNMGIDLFDSFPLHIVLSIKGSCDRSWSLVSAAVIVGVKCMQLFLSPSPTQ